MKKKKLLFIPLLLIASCSTVTVNSSENSVFTSKDAISYEQSITCSGMTSFNSSSDSSKGESSSNQSSSSEKSSSEYSSSQQSSSEQSSSSTSSSSEEQDEIVNIELFALNDFHGNVQDSDTGLGVSRTSTLLKTYADDFNNTLCISQGDMWQGSAESNMTRGQLVNDWMGQLNFTSMTLGNHEFDWGSSFVKTNESLASFPYLGINIYDYVTGKRVDYCQPSVIVNKNGAKIGIIGAIGDCYSSISASFVQDIYFKVGDELTQLVKAEAQRLKNEEKCDFVIYSIHDDDSVYDVELSNYVDLVLEGHTHQNYSRTDSKGVYHIQSAGYNKTINYLNIDINTTKDSFTINRIKSIYTNDYDYLAKDAEAEALFTKYADEINGINDTLGYNSTKRNSTYLRQLVADLYLQYGEKKWGSSYDLFLGGGYISCRSPYNLPRGDVTYADLYTLFPFDNDLVLCAISGYYLNSQFVNTSNENYFISYTSYGNSNRNNINNNTIYYLITDTYSSDYAPNHLTVIEKYTDSGFYARDMLAQYARDGHFA